MILVSRPKENGLEPQLETMHPAKRPHALSPAGPNRISPGSQGSHTPYNYPAGHMRLEDISMGRDIRERERIERERVERERLDRERDRHYVNNYNSMYI